MKYLSVLTTIVLVVVSGCDNESSNETVNASSVKSVVTKRDQCEQYQRKEKLAEQMRKNHFSKYGPVAGCSVGLEKVLASVLSMLKIYSPKTKPETHQLVISALRLTCYRVELQATIDRDDAELRGW